MKIVFFRHGEALSVEEAKVSCDAERPLSENGKNHIIQSLNNLKKEDFIPELIISSPYKRAKQTAELITNLWSIEIIFLPELAQSSNFDEIINLIKGKSADKNSIIVGHQPALGIIAKIITKEENIILKTAGYALIEINEVKQFKGILKSNYNL